MRKKHPPYVLAISSNGGHLLQLFQLRESLKVNDSQIIWVTFLKGDATSLLKGETTIAAHYPTNRNLLNLFLNFILAWKLIWKYKPRLLISTGAGVAIPFFLVGVIARIPRVFVESFARTETPSATGRVCYRLSTHFFYQWPKLKAYYPKGVFGGSVY